MIDTFTTIKIGQMWQSILSDEVCFKAVKKIGDVIIFENVSTGIKSSLSKSLIDDTWTKYFICSNAILPEKRDIYTLFNQEMNK